MNNKIIALVSIGVAAVTFMSCKCAWGGSAQELTVTPTANNTNAPITVRTASGALGSIKRLDPALDALLAKDAVIEKLAKGFDWSEGPVWMPGDYLLFSDVGYWGATEQKSSIRKMSSDFLEGVECVP